MSQRKFTGAKIAIFGGPGVGKTAFAVRYITKRFIGDYDSNKEIMYTHKLSSTREDVTLEILDTASIAPQEDIEKNFKWADGFVMLYSITDKNSFSEACSLKDLLLRLKGPETPIVVVANKCDLLSARIVTESEGASLAEQLDCPKYEISVAEGYQGVSEAMEELLIQLKRDFVKNNSNSNVAGVDKTKSKLFNFKRGFKKRIGRSHSDTV